MADWLSHTVEDLLVEIAWGADLTAASSTWSWTDVTADVQDDPGMQWSFGKSNEASATQPARCSIQLNNYSGDYSIGGASANWPNVRKGTPVRIRIDPDGNGYIVAFQGEAVGFSPKWDYKDVPMVTLEAAGLLRRLSQGANPVQSAYRRGVIGGDISQLIQYWTFEEGEWANQFWPAVGIGSCFWDGLRQTPLPITGKPDLASDSSFPCSLPLPVLRGSNLLAYVNPYTPGTKLQVTMLAHFPNELEGEATLLSLQLFNGGARYIELGYYPGTPEGGLGVSIFSDNFTLVDTDGPNGFALHTNQLTRLHLQVEQVGGDIQVTYGVSRADGTAQAAGFTSPGLTLGQCDVIGINGVDPASTAEGVLQNVAVGHLTIQKDTPSFFNNINLVTSHLDETSSARFTRICAENAVESTLYDGSTTAMGPQDVDTVSNLLKDIELADGGTLFDGKGPGLTFVPREVRENRPADLTVSSTSSQVKHPFQPVDDDLGLANKAVINVTGAGSVTFQDATSDMGTEAIGTYETSGTINLPDLEAAIEYAAWAVHMGTQEGYRYPSITINPAATPALARSVLELMPGDRIDVTGLGTVLRSFPELDTVSLLVEGIQHRASAKNWVATINCSLFDPWRVGVLATDTASPISFISSGNVATANNGGDVAPSSPAYKQYGDLILLVASIRNSGTGTVTAQAGWTQLVTSGNFTIFGRIYDNTYLTPVVSFTGGAANADTMAVQLCYRGTKAARLTTATLSQLTSATNTQLNASAANIAYPGLTVAIAKSMVLVAAWKQDDWSATTAISGFTKASDAIATAGSDMGQVIQHQIQSSATNLSSGNITITGGASAISRALEMAILPDPTPPETLRFDTDGSTLDGSISAGATSISVTTTSGPLWTTGSLDFPYDLDIGGVKFTVTACADATSPQTMTISAAPVARSNGAPVKLWKPPVLPR